MAELALPTQRRHRNYVTGNGKAVVRTTIVNRKLRVKTSSEPAMLGSGKHGCGHLFPKT